MFKKMMQLGATFILLACVANSAAFAQNAKNDPIIGGFYYNGIETSTGVTDPNSAMRYGNTFVLHSTGEWETRDLTVSLNYYASLPNGSDNLTGNLIVMGGTWSLVTHNNDGQYTGTLYGDVTSGVVSFTTNGKGIVISKVINADLSSELFLNPLLSVSKKITRGTLEMSSNTNSPLMSGRLYLDF